MFKVRLKKDVHAVTLSLIINVVLYDRKPRKKVEKTVMDEKDVRNRMDGKCQTFTEGKIDKDGFVIPPKQEQGDDGRITLRRRSRIKVNLLEHTFFFMSLFHSLIVVLFFTPCVFFSSCIS